MIIPDAPWVRNPERFADEWYGGIYEDEAEDDEPFAVYDPED